MEDILTLMAGTAIPMSGSGAMAAMAGAIGTAMAGPAIMADTDIMGMATMGTAMPGMAGFPVMPDLPRRRGAPASHGGFGGHDGGFGGGAHH